MSEWWRGAAIYQIYPRSFADTNGDGIGDLPGITAHLDHVASLGVDAVWLSPFNASPQADFGYDVSDYRAVDPLFGTLADFDALVARAHALALHVIVDQVWSHTSDRHAWFASSRADPDGRHGDWYVWADAKADGTPPNNWQSVFGGPAWTWDARRRQYHLHTFPKEQPQLNVRRPAVQEALLDVARFWFDRGVDGLRLDAINHAVVTPRSPTIRRATGRASGTGPTTTSTSSTPPTSLRCCPSSAASARSATTTAAASRWRRSAAGRATRRGARTPPPGCSTPPTASTSSTQTR